MVRVHVENLTFTNNSHSPNIFEKCDEILNLHIICMGYCISKKLTGQAGKLRATCYPFQPDALYPRSWLATIWAWTPFGHFAPF